MINAYIIHSNGESELKALDYDEAPQSLEFSVVHNILESPSSVWYTIGGYKWVGKINMFAYVYQENEQGN